MTNNTSHTLVYYSSFNNLGTQRDDELDGCDVGRSLTPIERTHARSKSVRGIQDLAGMLLSAAGQLPIK